MFSMSQGRYEGKPSPLPMLDRVKMYSVVVFACAEPILDLFLNFR